MRSGLSCFWPWPCDLAWLQWAWCFTNTSGLKVLGCICLFFSMNLACCFLHEVQVQVSNTVPFRTLVSLILRHVIQDIYYVTVSIQYYSKQIRWCPSMVPCSAQSPQVPAELESSVARPVRPGATLAQKWRTSQYDHQPEVAVDPEHKRMNSEAQVSAGLV